MHFFNQKLTSVSLPYGQKSTLGIYFHIPFCPHICPYCDFVKTNRFSKGTLINYIERCHAQLNYFVKTIPSEFKTVTVYFGGGTPSLIPAELYLPLITTIKERFTIEEMTIESNPYTNIPRSLRDYKDVLGTNRITLGAQSLCPQTLKFLGRPHTPKDVLSNLLVLKEEIGIEEIQVDLIYGLQKNIRTMAVEKEIEILLQNHATGISAYALTIEKNTPFSAHPDYADETTTLEEFEKIYRACADLKRVETSNFTKLNSFHNHIYWHGYPYLGIGTGAHGLLPPTKEFPFGRRYKVSSASGTSSLIYNDEKEIDDLFSICYEENRKQADCRDELIYTLLRTQTGIPKEWINLISGKEIWNTLTNSPKIHRANEEGKIIINDSHLRLAEEEKLRGDMWAVEIQTILAKLD